MAKKMTFFLHFLFILKIPTVMGEMRKTIKVVKRAFPFDWDNGITKVFDSTDEKEVTLCLRFRTFSYNEGVGWPFVIGSQCEYTGEDCPDKFGWNYSFGWKTGLEDKIGDKIGQSGGTMLFFSHDNQTKREQNFQVAEKTQWHNHLYEDWLYPFDWQSACLTWSVVKNFEMVYVNGKFVQGYEWSLQLKKGWGDGPKLLILAMNWKGEITDLNIYASAFDEEEMKRWTTSCDTPTPGDILDWHPETYNITDTNQTAAIVSEIDAKDLCSGEDKVVLEIFDDQQLKSPGMSEDHCARLNGRLNLIPTTDEEALPFANAFEDYALKANLTDIRKTFWVGGQAYINGTEMVDSKEGYQVYPKGGLWVIKDPVTGDIIGKPPVWSPTGHSFSKITQECVACGVTYRGESLAPGEQFCKRRAECINEFHCFSQKCDAKVFLWGLMCKFNQKVKLLLKGLCKEHKVDTEYFLLGYEVLDPGGGHRRKYGGSMGWLLSHDKARDVWMLEHYHYPHLTLTMEDKDSLPVGLHSWKVENNTCNLGQTNRLCLTFQQGFF